MDFRVDYSSASGTALTDCSFLAQRYDRDFGFRVGDGECHVVSFAPSGDPQAPVNIALSYQTTAWLTDLWRSTDRAVFVSESMGNIHWIADINAQGPARQWNNVELDASLYGIWGLSKQDVFCWGRRPSGMVLFRFDGRDWREITGPGFEIEAMHGPSEDLMFAAGSDGRVARWEGNAWREFRTGAADRLVDVHVAAPNEYYAVGNLGSVLEGSDTGWIKIGQIPDTMQGDVQAVARWGGHLWVGASRLGLLRRIGTTDQYERFKPKATAVALDTRGAGLLIGCDYFVGEMTDGKSITLSGVDYVANARGTREFGDF
jgi:hypothetical protein